MVFEVVSLRRGSTVHCILCFVPLRDPGQNPGQKSGQKPGHENYSQPAVAPFILCLDAFHVFSGRCSAVGPNFRTNFRTNFQPKTGEDVR